MLLRKLSNHREAVIENFELKIKDTSTGEVLAAFNIRTGEFTDPGTLQQDELRDVLLELYREGTWFDM